MNSIYEIDYNYFLLMDLVDIASMDLIPGVTHRIVNLPKGEEEKAWSIISQKFEAARPVMFSIHHMCAFYDCPILLMSKIEKAIKEQAMWYDIEDNSEYEDTFKSTDIVEFDYNYFK